MKQHTSWIKLRRFVCLLVASSLMLTSIPARSAANVATPAQPVDQTALLLNALRGHPAGLAVAAGQSATLLPDGTWLLTGGRINGTAATTKMFIFDPLTARTQPLSVTLSIPRSGHSATLLPDGTLFISGGLDERGLIQQQPEIFDLVSGQSHLLPDAGLLARAYHSATVLTDGKVLVTGGQDEHGAPLVEAELFNPKTGQVEVFNARTDTARLNAVAALLPNANVLVAGGVDGVGRPIGTTEIYNSESQAFESLSADMAKGSMQDLIAAVGGPQVAATLPSANANDLPLDASVMVRFSTRLQVSSLNTATVTLIGPNGTLPVRVVPLEQGALLAVTPTQQFLPASRYTLFIKGAQDTLKRPLPLFSMGFDTQALQVPDKSSSTDRSKTQSSAAKAATTVNTAQASSAMPAVTALASQAIAASPSAKQDTQSSSKPVASTATDTEDWVPDARHFNGRWWAQRGHAAAQDLPALQAAPGVTALAGQVLTMHGRPLANVTLRIGTTTTQTDQTGRFLLAHVPAGFQVLQIDGQAASNETSKYGFFQVRVNLKAGQTTALNYTVWMPRMDPAGYVTLPSPTTSEVVVSSARIPGLELRIPAGTVIRDRDGKIVTRINITAIPVDRPPFPLPDLGVPVYFTVQPGGAVIQTINSRVQKGARLIYPNFKHDVPGASGVFWDYDATNKGWYVYGQGHISADGKQAVPDPGVAIYQFTGAMFNGGNSPPPPGPPPCGAGMCCSPGGNGPGDGGGGGGWSNQSSDAGNGACGHGGDPVSLYTGQFEQTERDFALPDVTPIELTRTYRSLDINRRAFGIGMSHPYDVFFYSANQYQEVDLILPNGGRVHYTRTSAGTSYSDAVFATAAPGQWTQSQVMWNTAEGGWKLQFRDGRTWYFSDYQPMHAMSDRNGNITKITRRDSGGMSGPVTRITSPNGRYLDFTLGTNDVVTAVTDNAGRSFTYTYDTASRLTQVTDPNGKTRIYTWDTTNNRITAITDPNGNRMVSNDQFDAAGRVLKQTLADNSTFQYAYTVDGTGKVTQVDVKDRRGNIRRLQFNAQGYVVKNTFPLGLPEEQVTTFNYSSLTGLLVSKTDALNRTTSYLYDALGNQTKVTKLSGTANAVSVSTTYDQTFSQPLTLTDGNNNVTTMGYDAKGNLTTVTDALGHVTTVGYDAQGRSTSVQNALGKVSTFAYDGADLGSQSDPLNRQVNYMRDAVGRVMATTDPLGNRTIQDWDNLNRLTKITDALGGTIQMGYDANGNVTSQTDQNNHATTSVFNAIGALLSQTDALSKTESRLYEPGGKLKQLTDRKGQVSGITYDGLGRVKTIGFGATAAAPTAYTSTVTLTWDKGNRLTQIVDSVSGTITRAYDDLDRMTSETTPQGKVTYTYDNGGRRLSTTVTNGPAGSQVVQPTISYTWDAANRLTQISQAAGASNNNVAQQVSFVYDNADRLTQVSYSNGVVTNYTYTDADEVKSIIQANSSAQVLSSVTYTYDQAGRRVRATGSGANVQTSGSDVLDAVYNANNQLTRWAGQTYAYDANGNMTSNGVSGFQWDERNRLKGMTGATTASFQYDSQGRRTGKTVAGNTTGFVYDGDNFIQELSGTSNTAAVSANLLTGGVDQLFARSRQSAGSWATSWALSDANNNVTALTDNNGTVSQTYTYDSYGTTTQSGGSANSQQYTGRENDNTGLYYYRNRYYMPACARFISEDPIGWASGQTNNYAYVGGNPLQFGDPYGLLSDEYANCMMGNINRRNDAYGALLEKMQNQPMSPSDNFMLNYLDKQREVDRMTIVSLGLDFVLDKTAEAAKDASTIGRLGKLKLGPKLAYKVAKKLMSNEPPASLGNPISGGDPTRNWTFPMSSDCQGQ
ncbi:MAG: RHS repeat-associated core domain-containing protein [Aquabacterium sp.]